MQTMTYSEYIRTGTWLHKMPHTGPIYYGSGARPYDAALKGGILKRDDDKVREFKTAAAAERAILKAAKL